MAAVMQAIATGVVPAAEIGTAVLLRNQITANDAFGENSTSVTNSLDVTGYSRLNVSAQVSGGGSANVTPLLFDSALGCYVTDLAYPTVTVASGRAVKIYDMKIPGCTLVAVAVTSLTTPGATQCSVAVQPVNW